ncbi:hypothetical protein [Fodinibius halophilus]|uniref:Uncharacterized protein n=1 Tax=Fodinibius halophilus TaxID=1736908 RepID=A0A6M1T6Q1_9BACT|nr:hypothetical protein [Fodinibius halophilus]NGP88975.1 hypothetical protein [Fodinibius halophilus]
MTKFLGTYRGAAVYEVEQFDPSEGEKVDVKLIANGFHPGQQNMKVDFAEEATSVKDAQEKIETAIDRYLEEYGLNQLESDSEDNGSNS